MMHNTCPVTTRSSCLTTLVLSTSLAKVVEGLVDMMIKLRYLKFYKIYKYINVTSTPVKLLFTQVFIQNVLNYSQQKIYKNVCRLHSVYLIFDCDCKQIINTVKQSEFPVTIFTK